MNGLTWIENSMDRLALARRALEITARAVLLKAAVDRPCRNRAICRQVHLKQVDEFERQLTAALEPMFRAQLRTAAKKLRTLATPENEKAWKNCGTGSGGFKPGNQCARGGGIATAPITDPKRAAAAISVEVDGWVSVMQAQDRFVGDVPKPGEVEANWLKRFRSRKDNDGDKPAFKDLNQELGKAITEAMIDNSTNAGYVRFVEQHGDAPVIYRRQEKGRSCAAEWVGGIHIYDSPFWKGEGTDELKPGQATAGGMGGYAAVIRHEYGHKLHGRLTNDQQREWRSLLPSLDEVGKGLTSYAAKNAEEAFCELFAIATDKRYDKTKFPDWVDVLHQKQREWLLK